MTRFLRAGSFPERAKTRRVKTIECVGGQLRALWDSGIHNAKELHLQLQSTGFNGSYDMVRRCVGPWRDAVIQSHTSGKNARPRPVETTPLRISSNRLSWLLLQGQLEREPGEEGLLQQLLNTCEPVRMARELAYNSNTS